MGCNFHIYLPPLIFPFICCSDVSVIESAIQSAPFLGSYTNHAAALRMAEYSFLEARINSTRYIIIVTDGLPTKEEGQESIYARRLREDGVMILAIGRLI